MTREATPEEVVLLRGDGQFSEVYFDVLKPKTIFQAQINQTFSSSDQVYELSFDNVTTGAYTDVVSGMLLWIGSTAGASDVGILRVRKSFTSSIAYFGETSEVEFSDNLYITVVDDFQIHQRHLYIDDDGTVYMDRDIEYSDQHKNFNPVPVIGDPISVVCLGSATTVEWQPKDASDSWVFDSTITGYSWGIANATGANLTTSQPTFTLEAGKQYLYWCEVTAANGKSTTGYRYVFAYNEDNMPRQVKMDGSYFDGKGWSTSITLEDDTEDIRKNALCILFSKDYYNGSEQYISQSEQSPQTLSIGWIEEKTIQFYAGYSRVSFKFYTAEHFIDKMPTLPVGVEYVASSPASWTEIASLTVDKATWHLLYWQTTIMSVLDVELTGDVKLAKALHSTEGTIYKQIYSLAKNSILAELKSNMRGKLYLQVDAQLLAETDRTSITTVYNFTVADHNGEVNFPETEMNGASVVEVSGVYFNGTINALPYRALSPGNTFSRFGDPVLLDKLLLSSEAEAQKIAGLVYGRENNSNPGVELSLDANFKLIDGVPNQYCTLTVSADDTIDGMVWDAKRIIPRKIRRKYDTKTGLLSTSISFETESFEYKSIAVPYPQTPDNSYPPLPDLNFGDFPLTPLLGVGYSSFSQYIPANPHLRSECPTNAAVNGAFDLWAKGTQSDRVHSKGLWFPCRVRSASHDNKTQINILGTFEKRDSNGNWIEDVTDTSWYTVYAQNSYGRILTANKEPITEPSNRVFTFSPPVSTDVRGFEVSLDENSDYVFDKSTSTFDAHDESGTTLLYSSNNFYQYGTDGIKINANSQWRKPKWYLGDPTNYISLEFTPSLPRDTVAYFDISWEITVLGAGLAPEDLEINITGHNPVNNVYQGTIYSHPISDHWAELTGLDIRVVAHYNDYNSHTFPLDVNMVVHFTAIPSSGHRIRYSNAFLYNICGRSDR